MNQRIRQTKRTRARSRTPAGAMSNLAKRHAEVRALRELVKRAEMQRKQRPTNG